MKHNLFIKNSSIIENLAKSKDLYNLLELRTLFNSLKKDKLISQTYSFQLFFSQLVKIGLTSYSLIIDKNIFIRYSFIKDIDIYKLIICLRKNSFFSMTTALNIQKYTNFRDNFIFLSSELTKKEVKPIILTQENIDNAFHKPYRRTNQIGTYKNFKIVLLSPKFSKNYAVINDTYPISSINRSLIEMIINVQYFKSSLEIIKLFIPLKYKLNLTEIFDIIHKFDLIYPYFQCVGYYLEQIGFKKNNLNQFKDKVTNLKFYTDKNQPKYYFDEYWNMYHI